MHVIKFRQKGFTLLELIVVIGILSIVALGAIAIIDPVGQLEKANDARRKADLSTLQKSLEQYYEDFGKYPASVNYEIADFKTGLAIPWGGSWAPYMTVLPQDPNNRKYVYVVRSDDQGYQLYASLERGASDSQACNHGAACSNVPTGVYCGTSVSDTCNYGVSSPNTVP